MYLSLLVKTNPAWFENLHTIWRKWRIKRIRNCAGRPASKSWGKIQHWGKIMIVAQRKIFSSSHLDQSSLEHVDACGYLAWVVALSFCTFISWSPDVSTTRRSSGCKNSTDVAFLWTNRLPSGNWSALHLALRIHFLLELPTTNMVVNVCGGGVETWNSEGNHLDNRTYRMPPEHRAPCLHNRWKIHPQKSIPHRVSCSRHLSIEVWVRADCRK